MFFDGLMQSVSKAEVGSEESEKMEETQTYAALDLEMTGLDPKQDRIIEIGTVLVENGEIRKTFSSFVNPHCRLSEQIIHLTGITQKEVDAAPEMEEVLPLLSELLGEKSLLGHRILSDYSFLKRAFVNRNLPFERKGIDTLKLARKYLPFLSSKRLPDVCAHYEIVQQSHRALSDAVSAHLIYQKMKQEFYIAGTNEEDFCPKELLYKVKKEAPASRLQKERLSALLRRHKLSIEMEIDSMSKNEVSRMTDKILAKYGR